MRLAQIAEIVVGTVLGDGDLDIRDVAEYPTAAPDSLSCADSPERLQNPTAAGALIVPVGIDPGRPAIQCANPRLAFARAVSLLRPPAPHREGVDPAACVAGGARMGERVYVGPLATIAEGAEVGARSQIGAGTRIGENAAVGADCVLHPNCVLYPGVRLGNRVVVHAGAVIGCDGFGYVPDGERGWAKFPQTGTVVVEDDVEIGANTTIDRAALGETRIGRGSKIDNLVQIAHNVVLGEDCILASQVGLSGSVRLGRGVVMGGQAGVADHVYIGDGAQLAAQTGATKSLEGNKVYLDAPATEAGVARRRLAVYRRLPEILRRLAALERKRENPCS